MILGAMPIFAELVLLQQFMGSGWCTCSVTCPAGYKVTGISMAPWRFTRQSGVCNVSAPACGDPADGDVYANWFPSETEGRCGCNETSIEAFESGECGGTCTVQCAKVQ